MTNTHPYTSKYLIVEWTNRSPLLFLRGSKGSYICYDLSGNPDSELDDWDLTNASIREVN